MKKVIVIFLLVFSIFCHYNSGFISYSNDTVEDELYEEVAMVFKERAKIWNSFLIGYYSNIEHLKKDLRKVVTEPLLTMDSNTFEYILENPSSYELINDVKVKNIDVKKNRAHHTVLETEIVWSVENYESTYTETVEYIVEMKREKNQWLLSDYYLKR